jgi:hypothetical protein
MRIAWKKDREHPRRKREEFAAFAVEELDVFLCVVRIAHAELIHRNPADLLGAGVDVLHVDKFTMRFPDAFLDRSRLIALHDRADIGAGKLVGAVGALGDAFCERSESELESRAQAAIETMVLKRVQDHAASIRAIAYNRRMANFFDDLDDKRIAFIREQHMFFVATAAKEGRINLSPKGMDTFRVLSPKLVAYLDLTGSGAETAAHVLADGRITIMFCSFGQKPLIMRLYGRGEIVRAGDDRWEALAKEFPTLPGTRQIILMHIESLQTSCGFAVPRYQLIEERPMLTEWCLKKGEDGLEDYRAKKNRKSIDGLPTGL